MRRKNYQLHKFSGTFKVIQSFILSVLKDGNLLHKCGVIHMNVIPFLNNIGTYTLKKTEANLSNRF
jgi:hypothetical protein